MTTDERNTATDEGKIATARINAWQAIVVALITGVVTIVTTLIATGNLLSQKENTAAGVGPLQESPGLLNAPVIRFRGREMDFSLEKCMQRARTALVDDETGFTGPDVREYTILGFRGDTAGAIWCHTDVRQVLFIAAGRDIKLVEETLTLLERAH